MEFAIEIKNVSVVLSGHFRALKTVNLSLQAGKIIGFIGPSGAGKTTLIRSIVGRQKISHGRIFVLGLPAGSAILRSSVSYMTQEISAYPDLTVEQNLRYFATMFGVNRSHLKREVESVLKTVDLTSKASHLVDKLSGGQKQRVSLGIALIGNPAIMVLDEPTVGLDPVLREEMWQLFRSLVVQGRTIIVSSHAMDEAERCDDLVLIRDGKILTHDTPTELCQRTGSKTVEESFLKLVKEKR